VAKCGLARYAGRYTPDGIEPRPFCRVLARSVVRFRAVDLSFAMHRLERNAPNVPCCAVDPTTRISDNGPFQNHSERPNMELRSLTSLFVDAARPVTYLSERGGNQWWGSLATARRPSGSSGLGTRVPFSTELTPQRDPLRQLLQIPSRTSNQCLSRPTPTFVLASTLLGAYPDAPRSRRCVPSYRQLVARICDIIKDSLWPSGGDPPSGPCEVAAEAGICVSYLHNSLLRESSTAVISSFGSSGSSRAVLLEPGRF